MARSREKRFNDILFEIYRELYANCTTPVDFDLLVEAAEYNEEGRKIIPYEDYEIDSDLFDSIVNKIIKKHRLNAHDRGAMRFNVYLGCSPKTISRDIRDCVTDTNATININDPSISITNSINE